MKTTPIKLTALAILLVITLISCNKEEDTGSGLKLMHGIFITNEGPFQTGTGTVTFYDFDSKNTTQDIFQKINNREIGNVLQSMTINGEIAYLVVNNAAKVEVVDASTFKSKGTIIGLSQPRYLLVVNDKKGYISDWAGVVNIVDLVSNTVTGTIQAGTGPEMMLKSGKYLYLLNSGGFTVDSTVTVIDPMTDKVVKTIQVYDRPTGIVADANGKIWVMCSGKGFNGWPDPADTQGYLVRINPETLSVDFTVPFTEPSLHPEKLVINKTGSILYFLYDSGIFSFNIGFSAVFPTRLINRSNLYALAYDADNEFLMVSDPLDYQSDGWIYRYRAESGALIDSIRAGIIPGSMVVR